MKKFLALTMAACMTLSLAACGGSSSSAAASTADSAAASTEATSDAASAENTAAGEITGIAQCCDVGTLDDESFNQGCWEAVKAYGDANGIEYNYYLPAGEDASDEDRETLIRQAVNDGANTIVCVGFLYGPALAWGATEYPDVHFIAIDVSGFDIDSENGTIPDNVFCVTFKEEQAGYLAGYASVMEGYTTLGFVGTEEEPPVVRYFTGFLQGAEQAAEQQGEEVSIRVWYTGNLSDGDLVTSRMVEWFDNGTGVILANGGDLVQRTLDAANQTGGRVFATDWDQNALGERVLGSAVKCYNAAVQRQLYTFFSGNSTWGQNAAGQTEKIGYTDGSVTLAGATWSFGSFSQRAYEQLYEELRNSELKVEAYADMDTLPDTPAVTVEVQN